MILIANICKEEMAKKFKYDAKELFTQDPEVSTSDKITNCKRFAMRVIRESGLMNNDEIQEFLKVHGKWLIDNIWDGYSPGDD